MVIKEDKCLVLKEMKIKIMVQDINVPNNRVFINVTIFIMYIFVIRLFQT